LHIYLKHFTDLYHISVVGTTIIFFVSSPFNVFQVAKTRQKPVAVERVRRKKTQKNSKTEIVTLQTIYCWP